MEKRTLYALLALLAIGGGAFLVLRAPQKGQRQGAPPRPVPELKAASVAKLELTTDKQAERGVADGKGARLVVKDGSSKTLADLHVGKAVGGYTMVRVDGKVE